MRSSSHDERRDRPPEPDGAPPPSAAARDEGFTAVYDVLRELARSWWRHERKDHTLQPTAVVHECWLRMQRDGDAPATREGFLRHAAAAMRRVLVDHARGVGRQKRGRGHQRVDVAVELVEGRERRVDVLALDEALQQLSLLAPRQAQVVELRFFAGMTEPDVAAALGLSVRAVASDWKLARFWLARRLADDEPA